MVVHRSPKPLMWVQFLLSLFTFMAELVKGLTHRFVDPACVGSNPTFRPSIGIEPSGKALDFDSNMRWFESSYPNSK